MNTQTNFAALHPVQIVAAAAIATVIAISLLWGVGTLFQSRGTPLERLAAAERACAHRVYPSERQACMNQWIDDSQKTTVAAH